MIRFGVGSRTSSDVIRNVCCVWMSVTLFHLDSLRERERDRDRLDRTHPRAIWPAQSQAPPQAFQTRIHILSFNSEKDLL